MLIRLFLFSGLFFFACVLPPTVESPQFLPKAEFDLIAAIRKGKELAKSGRVDLAEIEFRKALNKSEHDNNRLVTPFVLSLINSDLGYSLLNQSRYKEAEYYLQRALSLSAENVSALSSLGRLKFLNYQYAEAVQIYEKLIDIYLNLGSERIKSIIGDDYSGVELAGAFRNLAISYYYLGKIDNSLCYSELAQNTGASFYEAGQNIRLNLSVDRYKEAKSTLTNVLNIHQGDVPAKFWLDYGITQFLSGDFALSEGALLRVVEEAGASRNDLRTALLIRIKLALNKNQKKEAYEIYDKLIDDEPKFCERAKLDSDNFWPTELYLQIKELTIKLCSNENESLFSDSSKL